MKFLTLAVAFVAAASSGLAQEFEAASIRANPPRSGGFRFQQDLGSGGPGTTDPGLFRCSACTLATLIAKAYDLRAYQFPASATLADATFEVNARIPEGTTADQFRGMLQQLLRERFGLAIHWDEKPMRGYQLVVAKGGLKLTESAAGHRTAAPPAGGGHSHDGLVNFGGMASFRADHQSSKDLAAMLSDQIGTPVEDRTGLTGQYDVTLRWSPGNLGQSDNHGGGAGGGAWHGAGGGGDHGGSGGHSGGPATAMSGETLFDAIQSQLGLKLVAAEHARAKILIVDRINKVPAAN